MTTDNDSGYRDCACRDCFEVAIGCAGAMCGGCEDAGCEHDEECRAEGAYGGEDGDLEHDHCLEEPEEWGPRDSGREDFHSDG